MFGPSLLTRKPVFRQYSLLHELTQIGPGIVVLSELGYQTVESRNWLTNLSKLNVFIGPNNSGKSRLLRALFADDDLPVAPEIGAHGRIAR